MHRRFDLKGSWIGRSTEGFDQPGFDKSVALKVDLTELRYGHFSSRSGYGF